ncbi:MAG TPA: hypothetical protein VET23_06940 [Chitinophagaceae bacterium]|nr:hypothetical protein [Chitinophagaceae bacterium]
MEPRYATLKTIYEIVKHESKPATYNCTPRQIILRQMHPWENIMQHLEHLAAEELIIIQKPGTTIRITEKGMELAKSTDITTNI